MASPVPITVVGLEKTPLVRQISVARGRGRFTYVLDIVETDAEYVLPWPRDRRQQLTLPTGRAVPTGHFEMGTAFPPLSHGADR
jgi:hypothetical protein